jgi:hypothetical protein
MLTSRRVRVFEVKSAVVRWENRTLLFPQMKDVDEALTKRIDSLIQ